MLRPMIVAATAIACATPAFADGFSSRDDLQAAPDTFRRAEPEPWFGGFGTREVILADGWYQLIFTHALDPAMTVRTFQARAGGPFQIGEASDAVDNKCDGKFICASSREASHRRCRAAAGRRINSRHRRTLGMSETDRTRYLAPALTRGLDVIDLLADHAEGLAPAQISHRLGLTTSQLFRILATLEHRGFIARTGSGERYLTTFRLFAIAHRHAPVARLLPVVGPVIRALSRETGQAVLVSVRDGPRMVAVAFVPAPAPVSLLVPVGQTYDLLRSTAGVLHFAREHADVRAALRRELEADGTLEQSTRLALADSLVDGADRLVEPSADMNGVTNLSTVVVDAQNVPLASISIPWVEHPEAPLPQVDALQALLEAAAELETSLAGHDITSQAK